MGCDIHAYIEVKARGLWHTYTRPQIKRHYGLFAKINGTRSRATEDESPPITPLAEALDEIPEDASEIVKLDFKYDDSDAHSVSVLSRTQMKELFEWADKHIDPMFEHKQVGYLNGNYFSSCGNGEGGHAPEYEDVRMIVWFDN